MQPSLSLLILTCSVVLSPAVANAQHPRDGEIQDPDTKAWWHTTEDLSNDGMEGRDTGTAAYQRAANYVAERFRKAGLRPAGENDGYFQSVPMHEVAVEPDGTSIALVRDGAPELPIKVLYEVTVIPEANLPARTEAALTFRGYCGKDAMEGVEGKMVVCFGTQRAGLPAGAERVANARTGHAMGLVAVEDPYFTIEPPRWPAAYARTVQIGPEPEHEEAGTGLLAIRLSADLFPKLIEGTGQDAAAILKAGGSKEPLPSFDLPAKLRVVLHVTHRAYSSPNVLGILPGSDPALKNQYLALSAHLDGYGYGTPVNGDNLYNGSLDDAAYVALLIQFADDIKREHRTFKRSIIFCAFTGEEKGLLGGTYFTTHPTLPAGQLAADLNLDQLRPLFPLKILTAPAMDDTTLGQLASEAARKYGIELRPDREPERGLLRRADNYPFLRIGVPAIGFIFGYDPGTYAEERYREWYRVRYHKPQDDLMQPMDFDAAAKFNSFFYTLAGLIADTPQRPGFRSASPLAPKAAGLHEAVH
jgi:hypothetical protein